ncbi:ralBP1-associated Eps domain-containing protein 1-like isoform X2 [Crassostrea virginica]|uniref:RalBP1-associated Eps domain-containing protein 1-like isoform X4 n=1 Tax=Crassostrea virginica TaxID=6565 RepID=A0A8B8ARM6_CRAVI|nr:ralBP1-associated Eps domain-containing protein 1-like isoform X4 [Crassostrea virginica]XP_022293381.1 ralBP1-associated Eps domain-containing protein 1-like isoform X4 [Crassostrea virginica]
MEQLKLTNQEQVYYGECFQTCDVDGNGKISNIRASDLFMHAGLGPEVLLQISELCGAKRLGHFGRSQFYIALKLIAAVQNGYPPKLDSLNTGTEMPLPKFNKTADQEKRQLNTVPSVDAERGHQPAVQNQPTVGQLPPPPASKKSHTRSQSGQFRGMIDRDVGPPNSNVIPQGVPNQQSLNREESPNNATSPRQFTSPPQSPPSSPPVTNNIQSAGSIPVANHNNLHGQMTSPVAKPSANQSQGTPAGVNSFQTGAPTVITGTAPTTITTGHHHHHPHHQRVGSNSSHEPGEGWASFEDDEHAGLLAPGSRKPYNLEPPGFDSSSISSDPESVDDIWSINDDQKEYYVAQFKTMQQDLSKTITGAVAKEFFEKSKLHVHELSKIWQLSDLNRDGELSLEEFCIAMHLVVLRRHEIEIPDRLPFSLMPYTSFTNEEPFAVDHPSGGTLKRATPPDTPPSHPKSLGENWPEPTPQDGSSDTASDVASPSIKPLNFASVPVSESDKIVHPIAMRVSPESHHHERSRAYSVPGNISGLLLPAPSSSHPDATDHGADQEPPVPPPRPTGRSMSVDASKGLSTPPAVPPRASPKDSPAVRKSGDLSFSAINSKFNEFKKFESIPSEESLNKMSGVDSTDSTNHKKRSLSQEYNKMGHLQAGLEAGDSNAVIENTSRESSPLVKFDVPDEESGGGETQISLEMKRQLSRDKKDLQMAIRTHKERNSMLERLGSELNQELQEVMEQRIALEIQLEHLKPFSS